MLQRGAQDAIRKVESKVKRDSSQRVRAAALAWATAKAAEDSNAFISPAARYSGDEPPDVEHVGVARMYLFLRIPHDILLIGG